MEKIKAIYNNQTITKSMKIIEKAKKGSPIGTEKTWGGKLYIKTEKGWKPKAKGGKKNEEESTSKQSSTEILVKQATSATDEQLKAAINDPEANSELKKVAQEELNKRNKQQDSDDKSNKQFTIEDAYKNLLEAQKKGELELSQDVLDEIQKKLQESKKKKENEEEIVDNKLDKLKREITSEIDKKLSDMTGFKKITQTYVKKDGKTVVIKMKGDNQYKATSPGFKLESKPYESLIDFKKRIKEELDKQSIETEKKEEIEEKQELSFAEGKEFESVNQFYKWNEERSQLSNLYNEEDVKRMESEANEYLSKGNLNLSLKSSIYGAIDEYDFNEVLKEYGSRNDEEKKQVNAILIAQGYAPIANGLDYHNYKGEDYLYINPRNSFDDDGKFVEIYKKDTNETFLKCTKDQRKAIYSYTGSGYMAMRDILTESPKVKSFSKEKKELIKTKIDLIKEALEQNPLKRNMVLNRRLEISETGNNLSTWLNAKVGQVIEDKSFASFGMQHEDFFGSDLQITLLAKKGDSIMNVDNIGESEYLVQAGSKYKVVARGTNSIVVEII